MVRKLVVMSVLIPLTLGCSKKKADDAAPVQTEVSCLVTSVEMNDALYRTFEYKENRQLYRIIQYEAISPNRIQKRYTFEYDQSNKVSVFRETNLLAPFINYQYNLHRNTAAVIDTIRQYRITNTGPVLLETFTLGYDTKKRLIKYSWGSNFWRYEYDDADNVRKWYGKNADTQEVLLAEYSNYDEMQNVYGDLPPVQLINLVDGGGISPHNPGSFKLYDKKPQPMQTGVITYLYNEHHLPVEASVSAFAAGGGSSTQVYKFAYECL